MELLDVDNGQIQEEEVMKGIKALKNGKTPGIDGISAELLKHGQQELTQQLTHLFNLAWSSEKVPKDWRQGMIIKLPKKGDLGNCNNWRGITLLSVPGKVFCTVLLNRLKGALDSRLREEQAGFRPGRSCSEQILTLRNIIEQSMEFNKKVCINFVDFKKAFDSVHRETVWNIAKVYGISSASLKTST